MAKYETIYDVIIIGAGAAGLFAGASLPGSLNGLIIEKSNNPGKKFLMSGGGQCNLTRSGSIKDFISHYGEKGSRIRPILYQFNNFALMDFFLKQGVPLFEREDGKVFPRSMKAKDILTALVDCCSANGLEFIYSCPVTAITVNSSTYTVHCGEEKYGTKNLIIATGGCSYPTTGSDGSLFPILEDMGIKIIPPKPGLVPVHVEGYPYGELSGISIHASVVTTKSGKPIVQTGDLLFTHNCFSGPVILNISRNATPGGELRINYFPRKSQEQLINVCIQAVRGNRKQLSTMLYETLNQSAVIPKRLIELICQRSNVDPTKMSSTVSKADLVSTLRVLTDDRFVISGTGGFKTAMVTAGGVSLDEIDTKTMESKKYPGLYFVGEVLDVDGDTGGYNLQFAFSSAHGAAEALDLFNK